MPHIKTEPSKAHFSSLSESKSKNFWAQDHQINAGDLHYVKPFDLTAHNQLTPLKRPLGERYAITPQAQEQNRYANAVLDKLSLMDKAKKLDKFTNVNNVDCASQLNEAKREIKVLNYQLTQLVTSQNEKKNTLVPRNPQDIEVMEETIMTYKVHTRNQYCPIKVKIIYNDKKQKGLHTLSDLKIYVSATNREPNEHDCMRQFVNPDRFIISDGLHKKFTSEFLYISFYSMFGRSITVTASFPDPPKPRQIREQEKIEKQQAEAQQQHAAAVLREQQKLQSKLTVEQQQLLAQQHAAHLQQMEALSAAAENNANSEEQSENKVVPLDPFISLFFVL